MVRGGGREGEVDGKGKMGKSSGRGKGTWKEAKETLRQLFKKGVPRNCVFKGWGRGGGCEGMGARGGGGTMKKSGFQLNIVLLRFQNAAT